MKSLRLIAILLFAISFPLGVLGQQKKIPKNPFRFTDVVTGKPIPEVLVLPRYSSGIGIGIAPEGPEIGAHCNYLDKPFLYRSGSSFRIKKPRFFGLPLFQVVFYRAEGIDGILILAPKYHPLWFDNLWQTRDIFNTRDIRNLQLTLIPDKEWALLLEQKLNPLLEQSVLSADDSRFLGFYESDRSLHIRYDKGERELVRKFLSATIESK